jgi:HEAT repeat protein
MEAPGQDEETRYRELMELDLGARDAPERVCAALADESWRVRKAAAGRVPELARPSDAIGGLLALLARRGEPGPRNAAAEALAKVGAAALPAVLQLLGHPDPDQRKFAAEILGQSAQPRAESALVAALDDADANVRVSAAEALGAVAAEAGTRALQHLLASPDTVLRLAALNSLAALRRPPALPALVPLLEDPRTCRAAFRLAGQIPAPAAIELVAKGLLAGPPQAREAAVAALGSLWAAWAPEGRPEIEVAMRPWLRRVDALRLAQDALSSEDEELRRGGLILAGLLREAQPLAAVASAAADERLSDAASWALRRAGPAAGRELLARLPGLGRPARAAVADALVELADPTWLEPIEQLLATGEEDLEEFALRALARTRSLGAVRIAATRLLDPRLGPVAARSLVTLGTAFADAVVATLEQALAERAVPAVIRAIASVGGPRVLPALRRALRDPEPRARAAAAEAAPDSGVDVLELLRVALADEAAVVRAAAARSLGSAGSAAADLLRVALSDPDVEVRRAAVEAAGEAALVGLAGPIEQLVADPDGLTAAQAVRALGRMGRLGPAALRRVTGHPEPEVVKEALRASAALAEGVELALASLSHPSWDVRADAARLLAASGGAECLAKVRGALDGEADPVVRDALSEAVARLAER